MIDPVVLTASGQYVNILAPTEDEIDIYDIAHALANITRFNGHTAVPYTVAEHSLRCSALLKAWGYTPASQLAGLLHDATEAYIGDVATPLKQLLPEFKAIEKNLEKVIEKKFNIIINARPEVHYADIQLLASERKYLMPETPEYVWEIIDGIDPTNYSTATGNNPKWGGRTHKELVGWFMKRFEQLIDEVHNVKD